MTGGFRPYNRYERGALWGALAFVMFWSLVVVSTWFGRQNWISFLSYEQKIATVLVLGVVSAAVFGGVAALSVRMIARREARTERKDDAELLAR